MTAQSDPYSRIYWRIVKEYPDIYNDDRAWAAWTRLLMQADGAYPAPAPLPRRLTTSVLRKLTDSGLVRLTPDGHHYTIRGQDAERRRRSEHARRAAQERWTGNAPSIADSNAPGNADASSHDMPSRAEQSRDKQSIEKHASRANGLEPIGAILPDTL